MDNYYSLPRYIALFLGLFFSIFYIECKRNDEDKKSFMLHHIALFLTFFSPLIYFLCGGPAYNPRDPRVLLSYALISTTVLGINFVLLQVKQKIVFETNLKTNLSAKKYVNIYFIGMIVAVLVYVALNFEKWPLLQIIIGKNPDARPDTSGSIRHFFSASTVMFYFVPGIYFYNFEKIKSRPLHFLIAILISFLIVIGGHKGILVYFYLFLFIYALGARLKLATVALFVALIMSYYKIKYGEFVWSAGDFFGFGEPLRRFFVTQGAGIPARLHMLMQNSFYGELEIKAQVYKFMYGDYGGTFPTYFLGDLIVKYGKTISMVIYSVCLFFLMIFSNFLDSLKPKMFYQWMMFCILYLVGMAEIDNFSSLLRLGAIVLNCGIVGFLTFGWKGIRSRIIFKKNVNSSDNKEKQNNKRILYINHYAGSPQMGMEFRPYFLSKHWVQTGYHVRIVAGSYSHLRSSNPKMDGVFLPQMETIDGIEYEWLRTPKYSGNGISRLINIFAFLSQLFLMFPSFIRFRPHYIIASSTYPLDVLPAYLLAKIVRAKVIHEVHDLWPLTLIELHGINEKSLFIRILAWAEKFSYKNVDKVISMLPGSDNYFVTKGMHKKKYCLVPNGFDDEIQSEVLPEHFWPDEILRYKNENWMIVGYAGYFGQANALDDLLKVAEKLKDYPICFVMLGDGPLKSDLEKEARNKSLNVFFLDKVKKTQVQKFLSEIDVCYIGWKKSDLYKFGISPNKLLDYMASGKPIVHATSSIVDLVSLADCGVTVPAENIEAITQAFKNMFIMHPTKRNQIGKKGYEYLIQNLSYKDLAIQFIEFAGRG